MRLGKQGRKPQGKGRGCPWKLYEINRGHPQSLQKEASSYEDADLGMGTAPQELRSRNCKMAGVTCFESSSSSATAAEY